jgi:protein SCO1/2
MLASRMSQRALGGVLVLLLAAIAAVLIGGSRSGSSGPQRPASAAALRGPLLPAGLRAADFSLADQNGRQVSMSSLRGRVVLVTFIHSLCHDTCPLMVEQIKGALNDLPGGGRDIATLGVSVHPVEDTRRNRRAFVTKHEMTGRMQFVNGSPQAMARVWRAYAMQASQGPGLVHSSYVLLIDRNGIERVGFPADHLTPEDLAHDIGILQRERAFASSARR